jgi:hypothetical protein
VKPKPFRIIPTAEWGARPPKEPIIPLSYKPIRGIFHHTAGHALAKAIGETYAQAVMYARSIQNYHMDSNGWIDTGNNFLVTRSGYIFEGRHRSLEMCGKAKMVVSAHCPGQNDQPGVEFEHQGDEPMTPIQWEAGVWLFAWLCKVGAFPPTAIFGHRDFFATSCPGVLYADLPKFRLDVAKTLKPVPLWARPYHTVKVVAGRLVRVGR